MVWGAQGSRKKTVCSSCKNALKPQGIEFRPESYSWSVIQALISRGDRRITPVLELTREYGDSLGSYKRAFKELRGQVPPLEYYVHHDWPLDAVLPWSHLQGSLSAATILQHHESSRAMMIEKSKVSKP